LGFVIFWHKNIGSKAACKMLMKLTTAVTNISWAAFELIFFLQAAFEPIFFCQKITKPIYD